MEASNRPLQRLPTQVAVTVPIVQGGKLCAWGTGLSGVQVGSQVAMSGQHHGQRHSLP